jgi:hypothetical protein
MPQADGCDAPFREEISAISLAESPIKTPVYSRLVLGRLPKPVSGCFQPARAKLFFFFVARPRLYIFGAHVAKLCPRTQAWLSSTT